MVLENNDTLTEKFATTHKTVDLPSPNSNNNSNSSNNTNNTKKKNNGNNNHNNKNSKNKKRKKKNNNNNNNNNNGNKKKQQKRRDFSEEETNDDFDDDSDDMEGMSVLDEYDVYNSMTQTEDESPEPNNYRNKKNSKNHHRKKIKTAINGRNKNNREIVGNLTVNQQKLDLLNALSGGTQEETQEETDDFFEDGLVGRISDLAPSSKASTVFGAGTFKSSSSRNEPRYSTLSIGSEFQSEADLIVEDESYMDRNNEYISPRIKDSNCIEFYVSTEYTESYINQCFGQYQPLKIIPHQINPNNPNQDKRKVEAIFKDHDTAERAVQILKQHELQVVFKKSPRMTLVSEKGKTPILQPISSGAPVSNLNNTKFHPKLQSTDSVSTAGGDGDFGSINYVARLRPGQPNDDNDNDTDNEMEWTESPSDEDDDQNSQSNDDDDSGCWALEKGFSGSDSNDDNQNHDDDDDNNSIDNSTDNDDDNDFDDDDDDQNSDNRNIVNT